MASKQLSTRDGRFVVTQTRWDSNGSHDVIVRDNATLPIVGGPAYINETAKRKARDLARRADPMGVDHVRWVRFDESLTKNTEHGIRRHYYFTVSRLDPMYR